MRILILLLLTACSSGHLVPPLVTEDAALPSVEITAGGRARRVHIRTFGDPAAPALLLLHGSLGDARSLLVFSELADRFFVVAWDQRGNGLSERIAATEYTEESIVEEIDAIADMYSPQRRFYMLGHSFGGMYTSLYLGKRAERVERVVLLEPGGLNSQIFGSTYADVISINLLDVGLSSMFWQNVVLTPADHERLDLRSLMILLNGRQTRYYCNPDAPPPLPVWRPGGHVDVLRSKLLAPSGAFEFDFASGAGTFSRPVLFVAGECSALGPDYQARHHVPLFRDARLVRIANAGHRLHVEQTAEVVDHVRTFLTQ